MRIIILIIACFLVACSSSSEQPDEQGRKAAETNTALGQSYLERGQYEIALEKLKRAVAHDRTYAPAHTMLAILYETIGKPEDAEEEYRRALQYDPEDGAVNNNYGAFLCKIGKGRDDSVDRYFLTAVDDPFYDTPEIALSNAGTCAMERGDLDKAEAFLRQSLEYDDKLAAALMPMADLSYRQGSYLRARAFLQRYEAAAPMTEESLLLGYRIETQLGDKKSADRYRAELIENYPDSYRPGRTSTQEKE